MLSRTAVCIAWLTQDTDAINYDEVCAKVETGGSAKQYCSQHDEKVAFKTGSPRMQDHECYSKASERYTGLVAPSFYGVRDKAGSAACQSRRKARLAAKQHQSQKFVLYSTSHNIQLRIRALSYD